MSVWTHIVAVLDVNTYAEVDDIEAYARKKLENAPKITGSEEDAVVFVNAVPGYNISTGADCSRCEHGAANHTVCNAPEDYVCPHGEYQTRVVVTVQGDLRDREQEQTWSEWFKFKSFIEDELEWTFRNYTVRVEY